jgi:hypothetical protein
MMHQFYRLKGIRSSAPAPGWWAENNDGRFDPLIFWLTAMLYSADLPEEDRNIFEIIIGVTARDLIEINEALEIGGTIIDPVVFHRKLYFETDFEQVGYRLRPNVAPRNA